MANQRDLAHFQQLLASGQAIDKKDEDQRTPLHWAAAEGALEVVDFLVVNGNARLNVQDEAGWTPLMSAASAGHSEVVSFLLNQYVLS
jgi:26S proteasome non-ATPase regulatory subunit 10